MKSKQFEISEDREKEIIRRLNKHKQVNFKQDVLDAWEYYKNVSGIKFEYVYEKIAKESGAKKHQIVYIINKGGK